MIKTPYNDKYGNNIYVNDIVKTDSNDIGKVILSKTGSFYNKSLKTGNENLLFLYTTPEIDKENEVKNDLDLLFGGEE